MYERLITADFDMRSENQKSDQSMLDVLTKRKLAKIASKDL